MELNDKITDVIQYEGGNDILVWKHPTENFNTAQLIVHESQEAILISTAGQWISSARGGIRWRRRMFRRSPSS